MRSVFRSGALAAVLVAGAFHEAKAQIVRSTGLSPFAKDYKVDFAVPDAPAFKLLEVEESAILRPQTVQDLTTAFSGFRGDGSAFVVPKNIGVEFSPGLLANGQKLKLTDYQALKFLYALRFSGAANRDSLNRGNLAGGVRFSLVDEQDLRTSGKTATDTAITRLTASMLAIYSAARNRVGPAAPLAPTVDEKAALEAFGDSIKAYWARENWNATSLDIAFAGRARTADSLGHDPQLDEVAAWGTYANGLQKWGQLLLGVKVGAARDSAGDYQASNTIAARLYVGSNILKAYAEGQSAIAAKVGAEWLMSSGAEIKLGEVGWLNLSAGFTGPVEGKSRLVTSFKFKSALGPR
jgi:hypothetical protein